MSVAIITGYTGRIWSETARVLHAQGMEVVGIDNDMRAYFFGEEASTKWNTQRLKKDLKNYRHYSIDIRDENFINKLLADLGPSISLIVHAASQPSHDWAVKEPSTDFTVNANGTLIMLEAFRRFAPHAAFILTSTNKVYGDVAIHLPLIERETRCELDAAHPYYKFGIDENMSIDQSKHSLFGASKIAADVLT